MRGRWLINGVLLLACALLLLLARWQPPPAPGLAERLGLEPAAVARIRIRHGEAAPMELVTTAVGWSMRAPLQGRVKDSMAERLNALLRAPVARAFANDALGREENERHALRLAPEELADLGLADPWLELDLNEVRLRAGSAEPINRRRYLQAGAEILLIDDRWLLPLLVPAEAYLSEAQAAAEDE
jgi:hypothetical protein